MKLSEHKELKEAILAMSDKEKDKLLLRLIAKDKVLTERLHFTLLEDKSDLDERVVFIVNSMENNLVVIKEDNRYNADWVYYLLKSFNAQINHFYKITKSNSEEVFLKIKLLNTFWYFPVNETIEYSKQYYEERKLADYLTKAMNAIWTKFQKLHEDFQFDLRDDFNEMITKSTKAKYLKYEMENGFIPKKIE